MTEKIEAEKMVKYWIESSDKNFLTMEHLFTSKDYEWSLFIGHIVIEKLLKALFVERKKQHPPLTHNLLRLAELCEFELTEETNEFLSTVTTFNINARYEDYKEKFSKLCTKEFTEIWLNKIKDYRKWIKSEHLILPKNM